MNSDEIRKLREAVRLDQKERCVRLALTLPQGFTYYCHGRSGYTYYRAGEHILEMGWEMYCGDAYDIVVGDDALEHWAYPEHVRLTPDKQTDARSHFRTWLKRQTFRTNFQ